MPDRHFRAWWATHTGTSVTERTRSGRHAARTVGSVGSEAAIGVFDSGVGGLTVANIFIATLWT